MPCYAHGGQRTGWFLLYSVVCGGSTQAGWTARPFTVDVSYFGAGAVIQSGLQFVFEILIL